MKELKLKDNDTGIKVFVDSNFNILKVPECELDIVAISLENVIVEMFKKNMKNRKYENKKKSSASKLEVKEVA